VRGASSRPSAKEHIPEGPGKEGAYLREKRKGKAYSTLFNPSDVGAKGKSGGLTGRKRGKLSRSPKTFEITTTNG